MLRYNFKIAIRNLVSKKFYSFINILGLSIGMTCCLLIFQFVAFEYSFDTFNQNAPNLYRVFKTPERGNLQWNKTALTGSKIGAILAEEVPEVVHFTRLHPEYNNAFVSHSARPDKVFEEEQIFYADSDFFRMFSYPIVSGNPAKALAERGTVMLSESAARRYFGSGDPLGQTLDIQGWIRGTFRVNGIFRDVPSNSHLQFNILLPMIDLLEKSDYNNTDGWGWQNFVTYVQLHPNTDPVTVGQKFTEVFSRHREDYLRDNNFNMQVNVQPLEAIHLNEDIRAPRAVMGSYQAVYFFVIIGLITLLIALANYVNLTTARALNRVREVGIRKVVGARRGQLITQFLCESAFTILTAFTLAVVLAEVLRPVVNRLAETNMTHTLWISPGFWVAFFMVFCVATLAAGLYPAFALSSFKPVNVLKGKTGKSAATTPLRRVLVILQFTASITLLVGTSIVYNQLSYVQNMDLGIDLEQIMTVSAPRKLQEGTNLSGAIETFTHELHQLPAVLQTANSSEVPGDGFSLYAQGSLKGEDDPNKEISIVVNWIDSGFADLYGLELLAGTGFKYTSTPLAEKEPRPVIATETAVQAFGFDTPEEAIGQELNLSGNMAILIGVFKDFHWSSAHQALENAFFYFEPGNHQISIKVHSENLPQTIVAIEKIYKQQFPGNPFRFAFADDTFDAQYRNDQRFSRLFGTFAALAVFIACMGLFGLAAFTARQRNREIGIRKVMGATAVNIVALLSKDFLKLVIIGFLIAIPIAWYTMNQWLEDFAYPIEIHPGLFLLAGLSTILIALATVSWQSVKAALMNPVDSLKEE